MQEDYQNISAPPYDLQQLAQKKKVLRFFFLLVSVLITVYSVGSSAQKL